MPFQVVVVMRRCLARNGSLVKEKAEGASNSGLACRRSDRSEARLDSSVAYRYGVLSSPTLKIFEDMDLSTNA